MSNSFRVHNSESTKGKPTRWYSNRQEKAVAAAVNGKQSTNSGATLFDKSDVKTDLFTIECKTKTTNSESFTLKRAWFDKQIRESIQMGKPYSAIVINFGPDAPYNENYYIIDENLFRTLLDYLNEDTFRS